MKTRIENRIHNLQNYIKRLDQGTIDVSKDIKLNHLQRVKKINYNEGRRRQVFFELGFLHNLMTDHFK